MKNKEFKIETKHPNFKKWETLTITSNNVKVLLVKEPDINLYGITLTVLPVKISKYKWVNKIRLKYIKVKYYFKYLITKLK